MNKKTLLYALLLLLAPAGFTPLIAAKNTPALAAIADKGQGFSKQLVKQPTGSPTKTFSVKNFSKVEVGSALHVIVRKGSSPKMVAYGPQELVDKLQVKQEENTLSVNFKYDRDQENRQQKETVVLVIETANLTSVELAGAAKGVVEKVNAANFSFSASGAAQGQLEVTCTKLSLEGSGASWLEVIGKTNELSVELSGASQLASVNLTSADTRVEATGASKADVYASKALKVEATGASLVRYKGSATDVKSNLSGSAKVSKI